MSDSKPTLLVIVGSVRDGRMGRAVADWFVGESEKHGSFEVKVADLKELDLPMMTEPNHPRLKQYTQDKTWEWSRMVDEADAFAFVIPEYNFSVSAPVVNALDYLFQEWSTKPAAIVSYGGISGGHRAGQQLRGMLASMSIIPMKPQVAIPSFAEHIKDGVFQGYDAVNESARDVLDLLVKWHPGLKMIRES